MFAVLLAFSIVLTQVGRWNRTAGLNITKSAEQTAKDIARDLGNKTLRVVVKEVEANMMVTTLSLAGCCLEYISLTL